MNGSGPSWRTVDLQGVGALEVRVPTLRDSLGVDGTDVAWWHRCVRWPGASEPLTRDELLDFPVASANALAAEVMKAPFTEPPSGGSGG